MASGGGRRPRYGFGGGGGSGGGDRDDDWICPRCGTSNYSTRSDCRKCDQPLPARSGTGGFHGSGDGGGSYGGNRGGGGSRYDGGPRVNYGRVGGSWVSDGREQRRHDGGYRRVPLSSGGNHPPSNAPHEREVVPLHPPISSTGGPVSYPPSYGGPAGGYGAGPGDASSGGPPDRNDGGCRGGGYGSAPTEAPAKVKQCNGNCPETCDNARICISNLPPDVTLDELKECFGAYDERNKQIHGCSDHLPFDIKLDTDESGKNKGSCLEYKDPSDAHSAVAYYNGYELRDFKISVTMAERSAARAQFDQGAQSSRVDPFGGAKKRRDKQKEKEALGESN